MIDHDPTLPADFLRAHGLASPTLGLVANAYPPEFFFRDRTGQQRVKDGKWFTGNKARRLLPPEERGDLAGYLRVCIAMTRAVRRMHFSGLAHADLSNKNVLIDPRRGSAPAARPRLACRPRARAAERHRHAGLHRPGSPCREGLAIHRDRPPRARRAHLRDAPRPPPVARAEGHDADPEVDERLSLGERAVFVEDEDNRSNRLVPPPAVPFTSLGPPLATLFRRVFGRDCTSRRPGPRPTSGNAPSTRPST